MENNGRQINCESRTAGRNKKPIAIAALAPGQVVQAKMIATGKCNCNWQSCECKKKSPPGRGGQPNGAWRDSRSEKCTSQVVQRRAIEKLARLPGVNRSWRADILCVLQNKCRSYKRWSWESSGAVRTRRNASSARFFGTVDGIGVPAVSAGPCVELGQPFEIEELNCEMTSRKGHWEVSTC